MVTESGRLFSWSVLVLTQVHLYMTILSNKSRRWQHTIGTPQPAISSTCYFVQNHKSCSDGLNIKLKPLKFCLLHIIVLVIHVHIIIISLYFSVKHISMVTVELWNRSHLHVSFHIIQTYISLCSDTSVWEWKRNCHIWLF